MLDDILQRLDHIAADRQSGAAVLALQACEAIETFAETYQNTETGILLNDLTNVGDTIRRSQPEMAPLISLSQKILVVSESRGLDNLEICQALSNLVQEFRERVKESKSRICAELIKLVDEGDTLITHSNSSTVRDTLICLHEMGRTFRLIVPESRPGYEGRKLAKELGRVGIHCELIVDSAALKLLESAALVIVGADCVTEKYFVNKVGTLSLALGAKEQFKEFYVLSDTTKFVSSSLMGFEEKMQPEEEVLKEKYPNVSVLNPYFEKIPLHLISGVITEKGLLTPEEVSEHII